MNELFGQPDPAAMPLTEEEKRDLRLTYIAYRSELNAAEQENIARGQEWVRLRRRAILDETFIRTLHRKMLGDVWKWAGRFRTSEPNIGINFWEIPAALRMLLEDTKTWIEQKTYPPDEIAVRFHHRLVQIHPFPNGNGRHARLMADLVIAQLDGKPFSWGSGALLDPSELRKRYIAALQSSDRHDIRPLLDFARS